MSKQDKMMDMMANQEKTLQNMLRARGSFRRYLQDAKVPLDSEVASILTASTGSTTLTAFDFDSIIMRTAVYKRCMARGSDNNELLISLQHLATNPAMVGPRSPLAVGSGQPQSASQVDARPDEGVGVSQSDSPSLALQYSRARDGRRSKHSSHDNESPVYGVAVSSKFLLAAASDQAIRIWDLTTGEKLAELPFFCLILPWEYACLTFSPDGEMLAVRTKESVSSNNGRPLDSISLLVAQTGKVIRALHAGSSEEIRAIAFSSDNNVLACSIKIPGGRRQIALYATATRVIIETLPMLWGPSVKFSFVKSDQGLLIGSSQSRPRLWNITKRTFDEDLRVPDVCNISSLVVTRTGMIVATLPHGTLAVYDLDSYEPIAAVNLGTRVSRLICSEDAKLVAYVGLSFVGSDRGIGVWKPRTGKVSEVELRPEAIGASIALSPDGSTLFCGTNDGAVMAWDIDISGSIGQCRKIV
jgi:WD40 repeat protein